MKTKEDVLREVKENNIELIRFVYIDSDGVIRGYTATAGRLEDDFETGHSFAKAMPFFSVLDDLVPDSRYGAAGELSGVPDPPSFRILPFAPHTAMVIVDLLEKTDHSQSGLCARSLLKNYLSGLEYEVRAAFENEFYLCRRDENGRLIPFDQSLCFATAGMNEQQDIVLEIIRDLQTGGLEIEKYYPEYGQGQVEIVYKWADALGTADNQVFFREIVRGRAQRHGLVATFMPKPFQNSAGSGAHLHLSLFEGGRNILYDASDAYGLSREGRWFIGGLLKHMKAVCAFTAPTVNSYKRLVPHHWASAYVAWGLDNRETALRIVTGLRAREEDSFNIEVKPTDPACNPYLAVLAALAAGMDGLRNQIEPGPPAMIDPYDMSEEERREMGITRLPTTLGEAVDALAADPFFEPILGRVFYDEYIKLKRFAWTRYIEHVSDWEVEKYAEAF